MLAYAQTSQQWLGIVSMARKRGANEQASPEESLVLPVKPVGSCQRVCVIRLSIRRNVPRLCTFNALAATCKELEITAQVLINPLSTLGLQQEIVDNRGSRTTRLRKRYLLAR